MSINNYVFNYINSKKYPIKLIIKINIKKFINNYDDLFNYINSKKNS